MACRWRLDARPDDDYYSASEHTDTATVIVVDRTSEKHSWYGSNIVHRKDKPGA